MLTGARLVVDPQGASLVATTLRGTMSFGPNTIRAASASPVVAKVDTSGDVVWTHVIPPRVHASGGRSGGADGDDGPRVTSLALTAGDEVLVAGATTVSPSRAEVEPWLVRLGANKGQQLGVLRPPPRRNEPLLELGGAFALSDGRIWMAGSVPGFGDTGVLFAVSADGTRSPHASVLAGQGFVPNRVRELAGDRYMVGGTLTRPDKTVDAAFGIIALSKDARDPEDSALVWARTLPVGVSDIDFSGRVVCAGRFQGSREDLEREPDEVTDMRWPDGPTTGVVMRIDSHTNRVVDARLFPDHHRATEITALAAQHEAGGAIVLAGQAPEGETTDFGHGDLAGGGFVVVLNERLQPIASLALKGARELSVRDVQLTSQGHVIVAGIVEGDLSIGDTRLGGAGRALFVAKIAAGLPGATP